MAGATEAPWTVECDALLWVARGGTASTEALPRSLRGPGLTAVVGGLVRYRSTPVGPYAEVVGAVGGIGTRGPRGSVAFMAVDSAASLVAGRSNWGLPKTLAVVDGSPGRGTVTACSADGPAWRVSATARPVAPRVPVPAWAVIRQQAGDAVLTSRLTATGQLRPALVRVTVESEGPLAGWLRPGRHLGALLTRVRLTIGTPDRAEPPGVLSRTGSARPGRPRGTSGRRRSGCPAR